MTTTVSITTDGQTVTLDAPYDAALPPRARELHGRFDRERKVWTFDARDLERVKTLARDIYGTDGSDADEPPVTLVVDLAKLGVDRWARGVSLVGREVAYRPARDDAVRLGPGVVLLAGVFESSGGSRANPCLGSLSGITVEVRDLARASAEQVMAQHPGAATLAGGDHVDVQALRAERARLQARLAEIAILLDGPVS